MSSVCWIQERVPGNCKDPDMGVSNQTLVLCKISVHYNCWDTFPYPKVTF